MFPGDPQPTSKTLESDELVSLYERVAKAQESRTALRVLGDLLAEMKDAVVSRIATAAPDAMEYAKWAGSLWVIQSISKNLSINIQDGVDANEALRSEKEELDT